MQRRAGVEGTVHDGVFFTEELPTGWRISAKPVMVKLKRQNADLRAIKDLLSEQVRQQGADAVVGFSYGQRSSVFGWDGNYWYGQGHVAHSPTTPDGR